MSATQRIAEERRGKKRKNSSSFGNDWKGFVDISLTDDDRARLPVWEGSGDYEMSDCLAVVLATGYKVSLAPHTVSGSVIATLVGRDGAGENEGYALSAFGPDSAGALLALFYKHFILCGGGSWLSKGETGQKQLPMFG